MPMTGGGTCVKEFNTNQSINGYVYSGNILINRRDVGFY